MFFVRMQPSFARALPFLLMAGGSGALFLANIYGRFILPSDAYGSYSYVVTLASVLVTFGMLGLDQTLIRTSVLRDDILHVSRTGILSAIGTLVVSCVVATGLLLIKGFHYSLLYGAFLLVIAASYLSYQIYRTKGLLASSQLLNNAWRIAMLFGLLISTAFPSSIRLPGGAAIALIATIGASFFISCQYRKHWRLDEHIGLDAQVTLGFLATMVTAAFLTYADRFIIEDHLGVEELGRYFFYQNIFLFPLTMIATYTGFKEVHIFKVDRSMRPIKRSLWRGAVISLLFAVPYAIVISMTALVPRDLRYTCMLLVILGMTRIPYASLSAAQSVHARPRDLHFANVVSLTAFGAGFLMMTWVGFSIEGLVACQILAWACRLLYVYVRVRTNLRTGLAA